MRHLWLMMACLWPLLASGGEIYRCTGDAGEPAFSRRPCGTANPPLLQSTPPRAASGGLRASERAWLDERRRQRHDPAKPRSMPTRGSGRRDRQAYRCREKRRALEKVRGRLRRGYKPAQGEALRKRRRSYEDYLATFCS
ncbi:MAG: DUF4124 domain-containing protein [Gammaproteobacteria bacterium]|nr:DUF4124 domain-containing protein [Gammaproteobacteria bacterium]